MFERQAETKSNHGVNGEHGEFFGNVEVSKPLPLHEMFSSPG